MKHWFTDGKTSKYCEECPDGFKPGRIKKHTEAEQRNLNEVKKITETISADEFISFYINHTVIETMEKYHLRSSKILTRILMAFNYDFSKSKPSKFKGKKAARSHESYVMGGKKSAETQKKHWELKSEADKLIWSKKQKSAHESPQVKQLISTANKNYWKNLPEEIKHEKNQQKSKTLNYKWHNEREDYLERIKQTCIKKYGVKNYTQTTEYKKLMSELQPTILEKINNTKRVNGTFNTSKPEDTIYKILIENFEEKDIIRQYNDKDRYPFNCDFYIRSLDLFIELNLSWTHGGCLFDPNDRACLEKLKLWKQKAKTSKYYENAIKTWAIRDVLKYNTAIKNKLNYYIIYSIIDFNINNIKGLK